MYPSTKKENIKMTSGKKQWLYASVTTFAFLTATSVMVDTPSSKGLSFGGHYVQAAEKSESLNVDQGVKEQYAKTTTNAPKISFNMSGDRVEVGSADAVFNFDSIEDARIGSFFDELPSRRVIDAAGLTLDVTPKNVYVRVGENGKLKMVFLGKSQGSSVVFDVKKNGETANDINVAMIWDNQDKTLMGAYEKEVGAHMWAVNDRTWTFKMAYPEDSRFYLTLTQDTKNGTKKSETFQNFIAARDAGELKDSPYFAYMSDFIFSDSSKAAMVEEGVEDVTAKASDGKASRTCAYQCWPVP